MAAPALMHLSQHPFGRLLTRNLFEVDNGDLGVEIWFLLLALAASGSRIARVPSKSHASRVIYPAAEQDLVLLPRAEVWLRVGLAVEGYPVQGFLVRGRSVRAARYDAFSHNRP
ncbi:MAG: hypothetical protein LQ347_002161 [Umbilicaria vellea]|nr:MAG: hypothetical protein LQ347_002161 [Umbilicaria vellea]